VHGTRAIGLLAGVVLLAGCTSFTHRASPPSTSGHLVPPSVATVRSTTSRTPPGPAARSSTAPSPVDVPPPAVSYVDLVTFGRGPSVPVVVQRKGVVIVPGGKQIRLPIATAYAYPCDTFLATSPLGQWLAYTTPQGELRVVDTRSGNEWSLGSGCDPVFGPGGRLAYLVATTPDQLDAYSSVIVVRTSPLAAGKIWARGQLQPRAWAGDRLVYNNSRTIQPAASLVIASRPGGGHDLPVTGRRQPSQGHLVAASPDGRRLLIQLDGLGHQGRPQAYLELVDAKTLRVLSTVLPKGFEGLTSGVWIGDEVVASNGVEPGDSSHPPVGLIRFGTYADHLVIQRVAVPTKYPETVNDYLADFHDVGDGRVVAIHHRDGGGELLSCRVSTLICNPIIGLG
jgi:hypothetical protein